MIKYAYWKRIIFRIFSRYFFECYSFLHPVISRYSWMKEVVHIYDYPTVDDMADGMRKMLGRLHWHAGYDGRAIEFMILQWHSNECHWLQSGKLWQLCLQPMFRLHSPFLRCVPGRGRRMMYIRLSKVSLPTTHTILVLILKTCFIKNFVLVI